MVSIAGLDKALVLLTLHKHSKEQGYSFLGAFVPTLEDCQEHLEETNHNVDYFAGRVIKCELAGDIFDPSDFDRDLGKGAAQRAIDSLN